jgi:hypothetical protein
MIAELGHVARMRDVMNTQYWLGNTKGKKNKQAFISF